MKYYTILTIFPDIFPGPLAFGVTGKGLEKGLFQLEAVNIRDFAEGKHRQTDDTPYGGGSGMVMKPEPVIRAIQQVRADDESRSIRRPVVLLSPQGRVFDQELARDLSREDGLILVCGRYEGFDERIRLFADLEISAGDFITTGGEIPALAILDSVIRLIPGVLGNSQSAESESFSAGRLEYPQYTRPYEFLGLKVPDILLSGNHQKIERWRRKESLRRTLKRRPDLLKKFPPTPEERTLIKEILEEENIRDSSFESILERERDCDE